MYQKIVELKKIEWILLDRIREDGDEVNRDGGVGEDDVEAHDGDEDRRHGNQNEFNRVRNRLFRIFMGSVLW